MPLLFGDELIGILVAYEAGAFTRRQLDLLQTLATDAGMLQTSAVAPLKIRETPLGTLGVSTRQHRAFTAEELDLLMALGHQIGAAIEAARLYTDLAQRILELEPVHAVAEAVNLTGDLGQTLEERLGQALAVLGLEMGAIALRDERDATLTLQCHQGMLAEMVTWLQSELRHKSIDTWPEGEDVLLDEIPADDARVPAVVREQAIRLSADIPLFAVGELVGILNVASRQVHPFRPQERLMLRAIGHQLGYTRFW